MRPTLSRTIAVAGLTLALASATAATPLAAHAARPATTKAKTVVKAKPKVKVTPPRPVRYVVVGSLSSVDTVAGSLTLVATGGNAKIKQAPVTLAVTGGATVSRDGATATLADLVAGDHVAASGSRSGTTVTITKVVATSPEPEPQPEPEPEPTTVEPTS